MCNVKFKEMNASVIHVRKRSYSKKKVSEENGGEEKKIKVEEKESAWKIEEEGFDDLL